MIVSEADLTPIREGCVLTGGVFDPFHVGHVQSLEKARALCTQADAVLVVGVEDNLRKHPPVVPLAMRAKLLERFADVIVPQETTSTPDLIRLLKPAYYVKGKDWDGTLPTDHLDACAEVGCEIRYTASSCGSSSEYLKQYQQAQNAEKLAAFETFVREQRPATTPWEPVTDYSFEARKEIEGPHADRIAEMFSGCSVLDVGCGYGYLVRLLQERGMEAIGYDPHVPHKPPNQKRFSDLVICREVLEHLTVSQIAEAIRDLCYWARKFVYITTRFTAKAHLLDVDGADDLDPTHITMLNQSLLRTLFVLEGCTRRRDLEGQLDWRQVHRVLVYEVPHD